MAPAKMGGGGGGEKILQIQNCATFKFEMAYSEIAYERIGCHQNIRFETTSKIQRASRA